MNFNERILLARSKKEVQQLGKELDNKEKTLEVIKLLEGETKLARKAGWVLNHSFDQGNIYLQKEVFLLVQILKRTNDHAVKRNIIRILQFVELPQEVHADLLDFLLKTTINEKETVAVRAFGIEVLANLYMFYPEIKNELVFVCEEGLNSESAGLKYKSRKTLKKLK